MTAASASDGALEKQRPARSPGQSVSRGVIILIGAASIVVVSAGLKAGASIVAPTFLALVITIAVQPLRDWSARHGLPPLPTLLLALLGAYVSILSLNVALVVSLGRFAALLPGYADQIEQLLNAITTRLESFGVGAEQVRQILDAFAPGQLIGVVAGVLSAGLSFSSNLLLILTLLLFMAIDAVHFPAKLRVVGTQRPLIAEALDRFAAGTRRYLLASTVFGAIVAAFDAGFLVLIGMPAALLWGLLAFITNYIPNIGFVIGLAPPALLGLLEGGPWLMLWIVVFYSVVNFGIQGVIQPKVVGDAVDLSPSVTMLSLVFWGWILGPLGVLLAIPLTLLVKALLVDVDPDSTWLGTLLGGARSGRE